MSWGVWSWHIATVKRRCGIWMTTRCSCGIWHNLPPHRWTSQTLSAPFPESVSPAGYTNRLLLNWVATCDFNRFLYIIYQLLMLQWIKFCLWLCSNSPPNYHFIWRRSCQCIPVYRLKDASCRGQSEFVFQNLKKSMLKNQMTNKSFSFWVNVFRDIQTYPFACNSLYLKTFTDCQKFTCFRF